MPVSVVTDSVASIPIADADAFGISVVSLYVNDGESNQADVDIDHDAFYRRLADMSHLPTSSQPSVDALLTAFKTAAERGSDVVGVFISEKMSGTVATARMAADMVREQIPTARIEVVDSQSNSMQEGFAALSAAAAAQSGEPLERCVEAALATTRRTRYLFTPASLEYLRRGGRIGNASALLGNLLQIRPILTVENGETTTFSKVRTQGKALTEIARQFSEDIGSFGFKRAVVHYIGDREPAERFAAEQVAQIAGADVQVIPVSPVIGLHVGPAVAIAYETERDMRP